MGGFGALKLGLAYPENWSKIGCFSAAHFEYQPPSPRNQAMLSRVYGGEIDRYDAQIAADVVNINAGKLPLSICHYCGDQDILKENAFKTRAFFESLPTGAIHYQFEMPIGHHDWTLWDESVRRFSNALNLSKPEVRLL